MILEQQKKAPVKSAILIDYNQFNYLIIKYLLPDAKMFKNIPKYHVVRNFPRNIA